MNLAILGKKAQSLPSKHILPIILRPHRKIGDANDPSPGKLGFSLQFSARTELRKTVANPFIVHPRTIALNLCTVPDLSHKVGP